MYLLLLDVPLQNFFYYGKNILHWALWICDDVVPRETVVSCCLLGPLHDEIIITATIL